MITQEINIDLKPSKQFILFSVLTILGCFGIILYVPILYWFKFILILFVIAYGTSIVWRYGLLKHSNSILKLWRNTQGWQFLTNKEVVSAELLGDSTITSWVCILRFKREGERVKQSCLIFRDTLEKEQYRRLLGFLHSC